MPSRNRNRWKPSNKKYKRKYNSYTINLSDKTSFQVITNIPDNKSGINSLEAALDCWLARTKEYTDVSFVTYINSKASISGFSAITIEEYNKILKP